MRRTSKRSNKSLTDSSFLRMELIERRLLFAVTASFSAGTGILSVTGDTLDNAITVSRNTAGTILVNGGAVPVSGGTPTVANTTLIQMFGLDGNDLLALDQSNGVLPAAEINGGNHNDTIIGGSGVDNLFGNAGNDLIDGRGGNDFLFGGAGDDTLTGGAGDDQVFGEADNDRFIWNPGDGIDLNEGGSGVDTVEINGGVGAEVFTTTANGTRVRFDRLEPAPFFIDIGTSENLVVNMNGGNDQFSATGNLAALIAISVDGGSGNDTILGSNGADLLRGGDGDDFIDGQQGNDVVFMGAGNDVFQWDPGDGSDIVEGQTGTDAILFNGSSGSEIFEASANGSRLRFTRNLGNIVIDADDIQHFGLNALGGTDTVIVNNLSGTDVTEFNVNLAAPGGGGDAAADTVIVNASSGNDIIDVVGSGTPFFVLGLSAVVQISGSEGANDALVVNGLAGDDRINATTLPAGVVKLTLDGGSDNDTLLGSQGADVLLGGAGNDFVLGDGGNDLALMGAGNDVFQWDPGDGSDTIEGQDDQDTLLFFGSNASENVNISANGGRILFFRDVASVTMDMDDLEIITFHALGGADNIFVGDLSGTDATTVNLNFAGAGGAGDGAPDTASVNGTNSADTFGFTNNGATVQGFGLAANVSITGIDPSLDRLSANALGEADVLDASGLAAGVILTTFNGGLGNDTILGSQGNDLILGGDGNDLIMAGAGNDTITWNPGDDNDTVEGQAGIDTLQFNGANVAENIALNANGTRARLFRDVASVLLDLDAVEAVNLAVLGGADTLTVGGLEGTGVTQVNIDLAAAGGVGDAQADTINLLGNAGTDSMLVTGNASALHFIGAPTSYTINRVEPANERINITPLGGADTIEFGAITGLEGLPVFVNLSTTSGGTSPDTNTDVVALDFNDAGNNAGVVDSGTATLVTGGPITLTVANAGVTDTLRLNTLGGVDVINVNQAGNANAIRRVVVDAGGDADSITVTNTAADGSVTILPSSGNDNVSVNIDALFQANAVFQGTQRIGNLAIGAGGRAMIAVDGGTVLTAGSLGISGTGRFDLTDNSMIIDHDASSPIAAIQNLLTAGYASGAWTGTGITSSTAATTPGRAVGLAQSTDLFASFPAVFAGQSVDSTSVLLRYTLAGDATLDRVVDINDFARLASNFNTPGRRWSHGDFDFNGHVALADFSTLASNFGQVAARSGGPDLFGERRIGLDAL